MPPIARPGKASSGNMEWHELRYNGLTFKYTLGYWGRQPAEGYPLYIGLHGGGQDDVGKFDGNNEAWKNMADWFYYLPTKAMATANNGSSGAAYIACRGLSSLTSNDKFKDEYDLHSRPESYVFYDQMIKNLLAKFPKELEAGFKDYLGTLDPNASHFVDSNRVYLVGHSAGGDGVFNLARCLPDLFAGVVASAGYACDANASRSFFEPFANLPLCLQVGEMDNAYFPADEFKRSKRAKFYYNYHTTLNQLQKEFRPNGYPHECFIVKDGLHGDWLQQLTHQPEAQYDMTFNTFTNLDDWYCDTTVLATNAKATAPNKMNAIGWVKDKTRKTTPDTVIWNLSQRPSKIGKQYDNAKWEQKRFFYWLFDRKPSKTTAIGHTVHARWEKGSDNNTNIYLDDVNDWIGILLREPMVQFGNNVTIIWRSESQTFSCPANQRIKQETIEARGDDALTFSALVYFETWLDSDRTFHWNVKLADSLDAGGGEKLTGQLIPDNVASARL